jgi:hypothetical protein
LTAITIASETLDENQVPAALQWLAKFDVRNALPTPAGGASAAASSQTTTSPDGHGASDSASSPAR